MNFSITMTIRKQLILVNVLIININIKILTTEPVMPGWPGDPVDPFSPIAPTVKNKIIFDD